MCFASSEFPLSLALLLASSVFPSRIARHLRLGGEWMMDGEKEAEGQRPGTASLVAMLFGEEKRRTSPLVDEESLFLSLSPNVSSGEECRSRTGSVADLVERPPESEMVGLGRINERKEEGREKLERKEENRGEEEERDQKPYYNVDVKNIINDRKEEFGEEEDDQEQESEVVLEQEEAVHGSHIRRFQKRFSFREVRHFPPPIPLLAQTGNLPCHMPWILKRTYKNDGRLVLREVNLKHHEFFRAHRSNGRLTLQVVHFEDSSRRKRPDLHPGEEEEELDGSNSENDPPPSPRSSSSPSLTSPPPPSDRDERGTSSTTIHEIINAETPHSTPSINSLDSPSLVSSRYEENIDDKEVVESSIKADRSTITTTTTTTSSLSIGENVNASMGNIVGGFFANSLLQMPIPTIRPIHS